MLESMLKDVLIGTRRLRRDLLLTVTAVISLAIGIGANTAIYTVARALLFRSPAGVAAPDALVDIGRTNQGYGFNPLSYRDYVDLRARSKTTSGIFAYNLFPQAMTLGADVASRDRLFVTLVSSNYFNVLGIVPARGRLLQSADGEGPGATASLVISDAAWLRLFNRDPAAIGRTLIVNGQPATIVGVTPPGFHGTGVRKAEAWLPIGWGALQADATALLSSNGSWLLVGGRRKPGVPVAQVNAEVETIGRSLPSSAEDMTLGLRALSASPVAGGASAVSTFMLLLATIVGLVLAVACANVAGMLLSRVPARRREMAVRAAVGATRIRLIRQLLAETLLLFVVSAGTGLGVARVLTQAVGRLLPSFPFPIDLTLALDTRAVLFTTAVAFAAALLSGLVPAMQASRMDLVATINAEHQGPSRMRLRRAFVVAQVALSLVLVIVGGLFVRAMLHAGAANPGFDARGTDLISVDLGNGRAQTGVNTSALDVILQRTAALPGVERVSAASAFPGGFEEMRLGTLRAPGSTSEIGGEWNIVTPGYFRSIRMPLVAGRDVSAADRAGTPLVAIVGEGTARRLWPGRRPAAAVGETVEQRRVNPTTRRVDSAAITIVGIVRDPAYGTLIDGMTDVHIYVPFAQQPLSRMMVVVRTMDGRSVATDVRGAIAASGADVTVGDVRSGEEYSMLGLMPQRVGASVTASLGLVGLLLAAIGVYGVTAHAVTRRTREIGIRMALGAPATAITSLILREGVSLVALGVVAGLPVAFGAAQLAAGHLAGLPPTDPITFSATIALFTAMGLIACAAPLRRALTISPTETLRTE